PSSLKTRVVLAGACCGGAREQECSTGTSQDETELDPAQEGSGALAGSQIPVLERSAKEPDKR
ncbi:MAG: hypothetical protein ACREP9_02750, partial [Candidatus Dormibacteraceae bacterium]